MEKTDYNISLLTEIRQLIGILYLQIENGQTMRSPGHTEVVELSANENTMHISTDMLPPDGLSITQLFPPMAQTDPLAIDSSAPTPSSSNSRGVVDDMMEEMKFSSKVITFHCLLFLSLDVCTVSIYNF